ncbi:MAG TPA: hypothetical protein VFI27_04080 [candidate division Zixibacteria bacterium]|nr:hypothetical protein [candidate division Zixibacteria bacterium]HUU81189.1 hypothetical protein [Acidobacteriota bacterium]
MADIYTAIDEDPDIHPTDDGGIVIGEDPSDDSDELATLEWDDNLAPTLTLDVLTTLGSEVLEDFTNDNTSRAEWFRVYEQGLKSMAPEEHAGDEKQSERGRRHLTELNHPVIAEAATEFQARAIGELFPPSGPVGATVVGEPTRELLEQAARVSNYMNYQITEEMEEYFPDLDQMLFHLPLVGHCFKKSWKDERLGRITSRFVHAEDLVVNYDATSLATAERATEILTPSKQDFSEYVYNKFYLPIDPNQEPLSDEHHEAVHEVEGTEPSSDVTDAPITLLEQYRYLDIESKDGEPDKPFIVTIHKETQTVIAIRRNWDEGDTRYKKNVWHTSYKFLPGLGFYGQGLYHIIGGLGKAATGALRALLDSAAYANMQGGFKLRGRVKGGEIEIAPGEFVDIDAAVDDVNKAIMALPFKEPSQTMLLLLQYVVEVAKKFANAANLNISDANQNTPVGTTLALLEENARVFSAIHKRLHNSQKQEFKVIAKLNGMYLPDKYPYKMAQADQYILRADFSDNIDVIPVSDPATFSSTQRIAIAQASLQLATAYPQYHNTFAALRAMYEAMRVPNWDEILIDPTKVPRMDAVTENVAILMGKPARVYEDQDHISHMKVLDDWFVRLPPQGQLMLMQPFLGHRSEHMAHLYRVQVQSQLGAPLPTLPNFHEPDSKAEEIDPETDAKVSSAAAIMINQGQQGQLGPPLPPMPDQTGQQPDQQDKGPTKEQIQADIEATKMKAQADIEVQQMKAQAEQQRKQQEAQISLQLRQQEAQIDAQIKQAEAQMDMQMEQIKIQAKSKADMMQAQMASAANKEKLQQEIEAMWAKADADIQIAQEKAHAQIEATRITTMAKAHATANAPSPSNATKE